MALTTSLNPAVGLTANKIPYALGNGRFGNSGITFDPAANGDITFAPNGTGVLKNSSVTYGFTTNSNSNRLLLRGDSGAGLGIAGTGQPHVTGSEGLSIAGSRLILGGSANVGSGAVMLQTHTTLAGGYAFGADTGLYRVGTGIVGINGTASDAFLRFYENGVVRGQVGSSAGSTYLDSPGAIRLRVNGSTVALLLDASSNATFGGHVDALTSLRVNGVSRINTTQPDWTVTAGYAMDRAIQQVGTATNDVATLDLKFKEISDALCTLVADLQSIGILN